MTPNLPQMYVFSPFPACTQEGLAWAFALFLQGWHLGLGQAQDMAQWTRDRAHAGPGMVPTLALVGHSRPGMGHTVH